MPRRAAGQRVQAEMDYSGDPVHNPLYQMRQDYNRNCTQAEYAVHLGCNKGVVAQAEDGMYPLIPVVYRLRIIDIKAVNKQYQHFRKIRRDIFWDVLDFPPKPAPRNPMDHLLGWFEYSAYQFASRMCIPHGDVHKMTHGARRTTEAFHAALVQIGLPETWIQQFNASLANSTPARVRT